MKIKNRSTNTFVSRDVVREAKQRGNFKIDLEIKFYQIIFNIPKYTKIIRNSKIQIKI